MKGYLGGLTDKAVKDILQLLHKGDFTDLFIDSSQLGMLAKLVKLRHPDIHIYTFFQNVEFDFFRSNVYHSKDYFHFFWIPLAKKNEKNACHYSDSLIVLNNKDARRLEEIYCCKATSVIPITMKDDYHGEPQDSSYNEDHKEALFVGSYFFGNTQGLKWFCNEILPHTDIHLTIVGSGMDAITNDIDITSQITIHSNVPDLVPYYESADFIVLPITTGGGMKVKTAEALKYGKYIIGTCEALEGYEVDKNSATICQNREQFIEAIKNFKPDRKYHQASRELFLAKYSYQTSLDLFQQVLNNHEHTN